MKISELSIQEALQQKRYLEAFELCKQADKANSQIGYTMGKALEGLGFYLSAVNRFQEALKLNPHDLIIQEVLQRVTPKALAFHQQVHIPKSTSKASAVILINTDSRHLKVCLENLLSQTPEISELILVVNTSSYYIDEYLYDLKKKYAEKVYFVFSFNPNLPSSALNAAIDMSHNTYVIVLDPSTFVTCGWFARMEQVLLQSSADIVVPTFPYLPQFYSESDILEEYAQQQALALKAHWRTIEQDLSSYLILVKKDIFRTIKGFESSSLTGAKVLKEFCLEALKANLKIGLTESVVMYSLITFC